MGKCAVHGKQRLRWIGDDITILHTFLLNTLERIRKKQQNFV